MSETPFFSVVIPVYNKEPHIARAINSVLNQTFQDFELIIVCDPSTDNSNAEVTKFTDPRIRVFHRDEPGPGGYAARNLGIKEAKAEWIAFLDADDEWYPEHLQKMAYLSSDYPNVFFMGCGWELVSDKGIKQDGFYQKNKNKCCKINLEDYLQNCLENLRPVHTSIACVNRVSPVVENLFPAESGAKRGGDLHAWLKMMCHHKGMAWSNHIGVKYFLDIEGQVVRSAESKPDLMKMESFKVLSLRLNDRETVLLKKLFNRQLRNAWFGNIIRKNKNFFLAKYLYFDVDFLQSILLVFITIFPASVLRGLYKIKKKI